MTNGGAAAAAAAARRRREQEEEIMTGYSAQELAEGWEFKIVRSVTSGFKRPDFLNGDESAEALRRALMEPEPATIRQDPRELTAKVLVEGMATGLLMGGNLNMIATSVGWTRGTPSPAPTTRNARERDFLQRRRETSPERDVTRLCEAGRSLSAA